MSLSCIVHCVCVGVLTLGDVVGSRSSMGTAAAIKLNQSQTKQIKTSAGIFLMQTATTTTAAGPQGGLIENDPSGRFHGRFSNN